MTADAQQDEQYASSVHAEQLAELARDAAILGTKRGARYVVVRQFTHLPDQPVSSHRFERIAQWCAHRRERQHAHEAGGHYTVRRADA